MAFTETTSKMYQPFITQLRKDDRYILRDYEAKDILVFARKLDLKTMKKLE